SIGAELVKKVLAYGPASLTVADRDENALHYLQDALLADHPGGPLVVRVADVSERREAARLLDAARPDYVLPAAAYQPVPLLDPNPLAALRNNVLATRVLVEEADRVGARKFLLVSSDKAVRPTSVMGATKRAAELCLSASPRGNATRVAVRFGNVVGSAG